MIGEQITCENDGCAVVFAKRTHNQRYHDDECCRLATNAQIKKKYHARRAQKLGIIRNCTVCELPLSRYNSDTICNSCSLSREIEKTHAVLSMITNVAWQA